MAKTFVAGRHCLVNYVIIYNNRSFSLVSSLIKPRKQRKSFQHFHKDAMSDESGRIRPTHGDLSIFSCCLLLALCDFSPYLTAACLLLYDCELGLLEKERTESEILDLLFGRPIFLALLLLHRSISAAAHPVFGLTFWVGRKKEIGTPIFSSKRRRNIFCNRLGSIFVSSSGSVIIRTKVVSEPEKLQLSSNLSAAATRELSVSSGFPKYLRFSIPHSGVRGSGSRNRKMKAVLVQNKIAPTICSPEKYPKSWKGEILAEKLGDADSCLTLHLTDNVLREIYEKDNVFEIWTKLEKLIWESPCQTKLI
ncbi:hypothetical protein M9H77_04965 [Catharanthus roseus]|uniref:Uncharacterized protein n=1 Tax=Catharanthus roseus TaxID=4058 RepID=A0ACC0CFJ1_CATRO|nr:hypothetical protein M9H77_04965 [Catharanthus roseus]